MAQKLSFRVPAVMLALIAPILVSLTFCGGASAAGMEYDMANVSGIAVREYDFGGGKLKNSLGRDVPCPLEGIIAIPKGAGAHPLVVVFHGMGESEDIKQKTYRGFSYLIKQLAAEGYVAVSFNINVEFGNDFGESTDSEWAYSIYKQHLALLEQAGAGKEKGFGVDLAGKIDLDKIHLIGLSEGGQTADSIARKERAGGTDRIKSLTSVSSPLAVYDEPHPDVPIGIVLAEFDGFETECGQRAFDDIQRTPSRKSPASLVFLRNSTHAYFNRELSGGGETARPDALTREQHENFLARFVCAFLSVFEKGAKPTGTWDNGAYQPDVMFGCPVTASYFTPGRLSLLEASEAGKSALTASGETKVNFVTQAGGIGDILFTHPGGAMNDKTLPLYSIRWTKKGGAVTVPLRNMEDFAERGSISLYVAADSSDALNPKDERQSLTLTLRDNSGAAASVIIPKGTSALAYYPGSVKRYDKTEFSPEYDVWEGFMPLGELRVPLSEFKGINFGAAPELSIVTDQTDSGAVMLSGIYLQK